MNRSSFPVVGTVIAVALSLGLGTAACGDSSSASDDDFEFRDTTGTDSGADVDEGESDAADSGTEDTVSPAHDVSDPPRDSSTEDTVADDTSGSGGDTTTVGACCTTDGCGTTTESECQQLGNDTTFNAGKTCAEVDCSNEAVCCGNLRGSTACQILDPSRCTNNGGTVKENATSCEEVTCEGKDELWACCGFGICGNVTKSTCDDFGNSATYHDGKTCSEIDC